jgi:hypothetical protein
VSYEVRFEGAALFQLDGIPDDAFDALVERVSVLADEPWDASPAVSGDGEPGWRRVVFGGGNGLLTFQADDVAEVLRIFDVTWIG